VKKQRMDCLSLAFFVGSALIIASPGEIHLHRDPIPLAAPALTAASFDSGAQQNEQSFSGVIQSLNGALFILRDDEDNTWYHLDDQNAAKRYLGKKVIVSGTLDARSDMIHVGKITPA
jgi:hypothetical protein